jgi:hypothetical protein
MAVMVVNDSHRDGSGRRHDSDTAGGRWLRDAPPITSSSVRTHRRCSRSGCPNAAVATLTYVYADSTAVVGPLATYAEPHTYDLCDTHAHRLTAPKGWDLVRYEGDYASPAPTTDDLEALADAVREAARPARPTGGDAHVVAGNGQLAPGTAGSVGRRSHLRVLPAPN